MHSSASLLLNYVVIFYFDGVFGSVCIAQKNSHCDGSIVIFDGCWIKLILTQINRPCTSGFPSENLLNRARTHAPTAPRLTSNVSENIEDAQEAAPNLCQVTPPRLPSTKTHRISHPAPSREETSGLPYQRASTPPTRTQCSPRPPPPNPLHQRWSGAAK